MIKNNKGFTLVELMVVLLIIAILIAVAVPVFLGARTRAQDNVARQALTNAARAVAAYYATTQALPADAAAMALEEDSYAYTDENDGTGAPAYSNPPDLAYDDSNSELRVTSQSTARFAISIAGGQVGAITTD